MATIQRFYDTDVVVQRLRTVSGSKKNFQSTATVEGHIQELDQRARQMLGILEEKAWEAWFPEDVDIQEGDRLTDEQGVVYHVREVVVKNYSFGINVHTQVILMEQNT